MANESTEDYYYYGDYYYDYDYERIEFTISSHISAYTSPVLLLSALFGNGVSLIVMSNFGFSTMSSCLYLALLSLTDLLLLIIRAGNEWAKSLLDQGLIEILIVQSDVACQVYSFSSNLLRHLCSWVLATLVLEVTFIVSFPRRAHEICVKERVKNLSLLVVLLLVCVNAHFFWTYAVTHPNDVDYCIFTEHGGFYSKYFRTLVWPIMDSLFAAIFPNLLIVACLVFILLRGSLKKEKLDVLMTNHFLIDAESLRCFIRLTVVLGAVSVIMTLPETVYNIFVFVVERLEIEYLGDDPEAFFAKRQLAEILCYCVRDVFLSFKIIFYVTMWRKFREKAIYVVTFGACRTSCRERREARALYLEAAHSKSTDATITSLPKSNTENTDFLESEEDLTSPSINPWMKVVDNTDETYRKQTEI